VGYLLKGLDADELQSRLLGLANGEVALSPGLARRVLRAFSDTTPVESGGDLARLARLTPRQIDVLSLVSQGQTYKEIGRVLGYSERSIKYFMGSIIRQLQLESRADAISYARRLMERGVWPPPAPW
jgi:DNA-binding NarL/FixJ family response regulator